MVDSLNIDEEYYSINGISICVGSDDSGPFIVALDINDDNKVVYLDYYTCTFDSAISSAVDAIVQTGG